MSQGHGHDDAYPDDEWEKLLEWAEQDQWEVDGDGDGDRPDRPWGWLDARINPDTGVPELPNDDIASDDIARHLHPSNPDWNPNQHPLIVMNPETGEWDYVGDRDDTTLPRVLPDGASHDTGVDRLAWTFTAIFYVAMALLGWLAGIGLIELTGW